MPWQLAELCDARELRELEVAYELEPYTTAGSDEALATLVSAIFGAAGKSIPINEIFPRLAAASRTPAAAQSGPEIVAVAAATFR